ncbi:3-hydroxyacyl-CoA dehydrogenase, partial [Trypanosoma cruzi]
QRAAPAAPEPPRTAPAAPEPPRAAPAAPEPPRTAPAAPEPPRTAPAAPEPPRAAPAVPEPTRTAPAAPEPPRAAPSSSFVSVRKNVRLGTEDNKIRGHRKRGGEREDRHPGKRGESFQFKGKPTGSGAREGSKRLSLNDIIDDVGEIKVVFAQRGTDKRSHSASPPLPPIAPSPPLPPSPTPSLPQQTLPSFSAPIPSTGGTGESLFSAPVGTSQEGEDDIFFTIAPRTSEEGFQGKKWPKSVGFSVDEEIETARATRPLVPSPDVAQETKAKLRLNVVNDDEQSMADMEFDKNKLNPLPHKEAAEIGRHEIPDVVSERADFTQPMPTKDSSKNNEKTEHSTTTASLKPMEESSSFPLSETATPSPRNAATKMPVERPPLAPWMPSVRPEDGEDASCAKVSFKNDGSPVTTILLETQPTNIISLVKFLHRTITLIENQHITAGKKTEVLFTTFPTLGFFNAKHGPLELTSGERVELLRAKESLFARMENASKQIHFVANVHGGAIEDFGAELFLACHHRVLLDPAQATFGFPSIKVGDFPAASTVRRLSCLFGSQRTIEMAPRFHEYNVESIMDVGLLEGHSSPPAPSFLLRLECAMLEFLSRATQKELLLRKLFFTSGFDTSAVLVSPNPLLKAWGRYAMAAIVQGKCATNNDGKAVRTQEMRSESIFSEMLYTTPAINAANVCSLGCEMKRRALPSLPSRRFVTFRGEEVQQWDEKMKALSSAKDDCAAVLLDCSQRFINATAQIVASHQDILVNVNVVLIGEEHVARPIISTLPCSVVVSCASPYRVSALGRLQEVRVFAQDSCSSEASETALNAALTYLQTQDSPYVVSRGSSSKRLIAALATEACRLTQHCDVPCIERVATDVLGLFVGPFHLIDYFGPAMVIRMLEETNKMNTKGNPLLVDWLPAIAHHALNGMLNDGYLGVDSRRGGFFSYREDGTAIAPNAEVLRRYFSRPLSDTEVADRLLAVVVNECCEMILSGCVRSATDANVLTIAAIGFRETTGGALALADKTGISALVQKMEELSNWHGPHLRPSSLLKCMAHSKVSFASLSDAMIQSARM